MNSYTTFAKMFAAVLFAMKAEGARRGPKHTGGAIFVTRKRRRHGRTYRQ